MNSEETTRFDKDSPCPHCGYVCDSATTAFEGNSRPKKGDFSICFGCGDLNEYTDSEGGMQKLPQERMDALLDEAPEIWIEIKNLQDKVRGIRKTVT